MQSSEVLTDADVIAIPSPHVHGIVLNCDVVRKSNEATIKIIPAHRTAYRVQTVYCAIYYIMTCRSATVIEVELDV